MSGNFSSAQHITKRGCGIFFLYLTCLYRCLADLPLSVMASLKSGDNNEDVSIFRLSLVPKKFTKVKHHLPCHTSALHDKPHL